MRLLVSGLLALALLTGGVAVLAPRSAGATWTCNGVTYTSDPLSEVIANGGFESDFTAWYSRGVLPSISATVAHSGAKSAHVVSQVSNPVYGAQDLPVISGSYVFSHWVNVSAWGAGGVFVTGLMRNWVGSSADMVTRLWWEPPQLLWQVWIPAGGGGVQETLGVTLSTGAWHLVDILVSPASGTQCLYIDGGFVATANVNPASTFAPDVAIFGDISQTGDAGEAYWDDISILSAAPAAPDYVPASPQPGAAFKTGESLPTNLSVSVRNQGSVAAATASVLAFYNASTPGSPFATLSVPALASGAFAGPFTATWTSPGTPGTYMIVAEVDYGNLVPESDEGNNRYMWTATVYPPPITTLVLGTPSYADAFVTSATPLTLSPQDRSGTGIRRTAYRVDGGMWQTYTVPFTLSFEGDHLLEWFSVDNVGNVEATQSTTLTVDDSGPIASVTPLTPSYVAGDTWVTSSTPVTLPAADLGAVPVGLESVEFRVWSGTWSAWSPYSTAFTLPPEGRRYVEWRASDHLGNTGSGNRTLIVDDTPPSTAFGLTGPVVVRNDTFVSSSTLISATSVDGGPVPVGVEGAECSVDGGPWTPYATPFPLTGPDGPRSVQCRGTDHLGNRETAKVLDVVLDNTPPTTVLLVPEGTLSVASRFTLVAADLGSGVNGTEYRIDGGAWQRYDGPFGLPVGVHTIAYRSTDRLGNVEPERTVTLHVENWKPIVALVFAVLLLLVAVVLAWRSRRAGWPGWKRVLAAGAVFAVAEGVTGILSALLGVLPIPPFVDLGTIVDTALLVAGLVCVTGLFVRAKPRGVLPPAPAEIAREPGQ